MKAFLILARMRFLDVVRSRSSAAFVLLFPVLLLVIVGVVFEGGHPFERKTAVIVAEDEVRAAEAEAMVGAFEEVRVERARSLAEAHGKLGARMANAVLVVRPGAAPHELRVGPRDQLFGRGLASAVPFDTTLTVVDVPRWGYVHYLFPGIVTFSVMLAGMFATGYTMVLYRQNRFLKKLATTPMPKATFVAAQIAARSVLVAAQIALLAVAAAVVFDVPFDPGSALVFGGITMLGLFAFMGVGFALACIIKTEDLVVDLISAVNLPLVFLSEIFFPLDTLPGALAAIGELLPSTAMVRLTRGALLYGATDAAALGPGVASLAAWTVLSFVLSLRMFKWHG